MLFFIDYQHNFEQHFLQTSYPNYQYPSLLFIIQISNRLFCACFKFFSSVPIIPLTFRNICVMKRHSSGLSAKRAFCTACNDSIIFTNYSMDLCWRFCAGWRIIAYLVKLYQSMSEKYPEGHALSCLSGDFCRNSIYKICAVRRQRGAFLIYVMGGFV